MNEKKTKDETIHEDDENIDYGEDENWEHVKTYDPSVAKDRAYKDSEDNRFYERDDDGKVHVVYKKKKSRYQEGMY